MAENPETVAVPSGSGEQRFGDYVFVEKIAQGGMAELFLAKRRGVEGFEKIVAIKRILPELSWNRDFVTMFINEAKIAARLSHPNIVQIFDFGKIDNYYFIAMEYVHGENLRALLQRAAKRNVPIKPGIAALIAARSCAGLEHAHKKTDESGKPLGIVHRDVSPQNVLLSYDGDIKVVDFGIAKAVNENPEATRGVLKGKLAYLSPEQVNAKNLDARSDVFAMGLVFYELLTGKKLFDMQDPAEILDSILRIDSTAVASSIPGLHRDLREVLRRALHVDPEQRFASAGQMEIALESYLREEGDPGGTMQLTNLMRLVFDEKIGEQTQAILRSQVTGVGARPRGGSLNLRLPSASPRLLAAVGGAAAAVVTLLFTAPLLRASNQQAAPPTRSKEPPADKESKPPAERLPAEVPKSREEARLREEVKPHEEARPREEGRPATPSGLADLEKANAALAAGHPAAAVAAYDKAFTASPELKEKNGTSYAKALFEDGKSRFDADSDAAAERFRAAIAVDPNLFDPHYYLAKIYTRKSDPQAAMREYQEAIRINPKSADAQFNLGFIYFSQRRYDEAFKQYEKVVDLKPPYLADVYYNLSACYEHMKRKSDAIATLRRGIEAVPQNELLKQRLKQLGG